MLQNGHIKSASVTFFFAKLTLWGSSCETPELILSRQFLAFICFMSCRFGDMDKLDLNVLYMTYLSSSTMESDHCCLYAVISNKSVVKYFQGISQLICYRERVSTRLTFYTLILHI